MHAPIVDTAAFKSLLRCCGYAKALPDGKRLHAHIIRAGCDRDLVVGNLLVQMYGKCGCPDAARGVYDKIHHPNVFSGNLMMQAYAHNRRVEDAKCVFGKMPQRDVVSWTTMIAAYSQNGYGKEAIEFFQQMQLKGVAPDKIAFISILDACADLEFLAEGREIHASIVDSGVEIDVVVGNALVSMYGKCRNLIDARRVFDKMPQRDVVSWTAMIAAYSQNGHGKEALQLFQQMQMKGVQPNRITFVSILDACANQSALVAGKENHASIIDYGFETNAVVGNSLINMYGKCRSVDDARNIFDKIPQRNVISWNSMIAAYSQNGHGKEALELFQQMQLKGAEPNKITFISILDACADLAALAEGMNSHASIIDSTFDTDVVIGNALVNMYGKCGNVDDARSVFAKMPQRDAVSWTAIIAVYSQNGHGREVLKLFKQMLLEGLSPDKVTFISVLSGCSHAGLLDDGWRYFVSMNRDYAIRPTVKHFVCMIDLLGRAGQLDKAETLVNTMPFGHYSTSWMSLLGACRIHGDVERGARAAEHVFELDPKNSAPFVLLSNIYAAAGKWSDAAKVRKVMKDRGVKKQPGYSCIEVKKKVHEFIVGDMSHPQKEEIYAELQRLTRQMEEVGYMSDTKASVCNKGEMGKQHMLYHHSEKLAIAFGLISTLPETPLRITKNLRVCSDCHAATKFISKIVRRKIIVRDASRFHHFEHGICSCGDYW